jgi:hypothetical protein
MPLTITQGPDEWISYSFMWHALQDACPECRQLNGRIFEGQNIYQNTLWDPIWGDIWDMNIDMPLTHGGTGAHCRCQLEVQCHFDWEKLEELNRLQETMVVANSGQESFDYQKGSSRSTTFEDIGIDPSKYGIE